MKTRIVLLLLLSAMLACQRSIPEISSDDDNILAEDQILSGGVTRHFLLHVPPLYYGDPTPLVLNFHGYGSNSRQEEILTGMSAKADAAGFIVVYPEGLDGAWYTGPSTQGDADRQFIRDLVAHLENLYTIDPKRIYATGISNGGGMADRLACNMADLIAAIAPDSGAYNFWQDCLPWRPVPVLAFHGLDDNVIPYEGSSPQAMTPPIEAWAAAWAMRNGCSSKAGITTPIETVTIRTWSNCTKNAEVILYALAGHGHSWPGSPIMPRAITSKAINATDVMWEFFSAHPMP